jgi:hypothetical protein
LNIFVRKKKSLSSSGVTFIFLTIIESMKFGSVNEPIPVKSIEAYALSGPR